LSDRLQHPAAGADQVRDGAAARTRRQGLQRTAAPGRRADPGRLPDAPRRRRLARVRRDGRGRVVRADLPPAVRQRTAAQVDRAGGERTAQRPDLGRRRHQLMPDAASVRRDGSALAFAGALPRDAVAALWPQSLALVAGVERLDRPAVSRVDSAGLALLVELAQRGGAVSVTGDPPGLDGLRRAYRLSPTLNFARA